jgi:hypothetical protein
VDQGVCDDVGYVFIHQSIDHPFAGPLTQDESGIA